MPELANQTASRDLENRFLIDCAQTDLSQQLVESISYLLRENLNWEYIFKVAERNAITPLITWNLLENFDNLLPLSIKKNLNDFFREHTRKNMFLTGELLKLLDLLDSNDISAAPFKGPMLAVRFYGNPTLRAFGDLDVLIQPKDLKKSVQVLKKSGYEPINDINWLEKSDWYLSDRKDVLFINRNSKVVLELHWKLSGSHFAMPFEMNRLWERMETVSLAGKKVKTFSFDDLLIYLCLHGARHGWERFGWICDVNELIRFNKVIDWEGIYTEAQRTGCKNAFGLALYLVDEFFGLEVPLTAWREIRGDSTFGEIARQVRSRLFCEAFVTLEIGDRYLYHLKLKEKRWDKLKLHLHYNFWYLRLIFSPNEMDENVFHFPMWLSSLYYITRPPRLFYTYLIKSRKNKIS